MNTQPTVINSILSKIKGKFSQRHRFNRVYETKGWDGLWGLSELARYNMITGYTRHYCKEPRILDLGCGEGVLQKYFSSVDYSRYLGIDVSDVAIEKAKSLENDKTQFQVGDVNYLKTNDNFDVIIYNESLYYLSNPKLAIRSLSNNLNPGGIFIVSMHKDGTAKREGLWADLNEVLELKDKTKVINHSETEWTVAVYGLKN
jgi:2-polyprenyl-3-methyl-5-hydroxy-6-metoxy-1,4-benzoquinol methylase